MDKRFDASLMSTLRTATARGRVLFLIGRGFSTSVGIPTFEEALASARKQRARHKSRSLLKQEKTRELSADIYGRISQLNAPVPEVYRLIAELPVSTLITTSYDELLERAFTSVGKRVENASTPWDLQRPLPRSVDVLIVKLLGDLSALEFLYDTSSLPDLPKQQWHTLLLRFTQLVDYDIEVFLGFDAHDEPKLKEILSFLDAHSSPKQRIVLTSERQGPAGTSQVRVDQTIHASSKGVADFLRQIGAGVCSQTDADPKLHSNAWNRMRQYLHMLQAELRYSWTVDRTRRVLTHEVPFRLEIPDKDQFCVTPTEAVSSQNTFGTIRSSCVGVFTDYLSYGRHVMLVGEAGSGKTTYLRMLARSLAQPADPSIVPMFFSAQDLYRREIKSVGSLLESLELRSGLPGLAAAAASTLDSRHCVFIIDALDELEPRTATSVMRVLREFCATRPKLKYVASCRPHLLADLISPDLDAVVRMAPLDDDQIALFLNYWFERKSDSEQLLRVVATQKQVSELARRPLFLGMLAYLWESRHTAPISVAALYASAVRLLLGPWDLERGVFRDNQHDPRLKIEVLVDIAIHILKKQQHVVSTGDVLRILSQRLGGRQRDSTEALALAEEIERQSGLFARVSEDRWSFVHSGFVDYLCSKFVLDHNLDDVAAAIVASVDSRKWIPVLVMAGSALDAPQADPLLRRLVARVRSLGRANDICTSAGQQRDLEAQIVTRQPARSRLTEFHAD